MVEKEDVVVRIHDSDFVSDWVMEINCTEIARCAGKKGDGVSWEKDRVQLTMLNAKQMLKLLARYADGDDIDRIDECFLVNRTLSREWEKIKERMR